MSKKTTYRELDEEEFSRFYAFCETVLTIFEVYSVVVASGMDISTMSRDTLCTLGHDSTQSMRDEISNKLKGGLYVKD